MGFMKDFFGGLLGGEDVKTPSGTTITLTSATKNVPKLNIREIYMVYEKSAPLGNAVNRVLNGIDAGEFVKKESEKEPPRTAFFNFLLQGEVYVYHDGIVIEVVPNQKIKYSDAKTISIQKESGQEVFDFPRSDFKRSALDSRKFATIFNGREVFLYVLIDNPSMLKSYRGTSKVNQISREVKITMHVNDHHINALMRGINLGGLLTISNKNAALSPEQIRAARKTAFSEWSGTANAGAIAIVDGADDVSLTSFSPKSGEMSYEALMLFCFKTIYNHFGVPLALITTEASTYNNYEVGSYMLYEDAVKPLINAMLKFWNDMFQTKITYDLSKAEAVRGKKLTEAKMLKDTSAVSINEIRETIGMNPVPGDTYEMPLINANQMLDTVGAGGLFGSLPSRNEEDTNE